MVWGRQIEDFLKSPSSLLIVFVSTCHIFAGVMVAVDKSALGTTPFSFFRGWVSADLHLAHGVILVVAAVLALFALKYRRYYVLLIFLQQVLLVGSASACVMAVVNGHYADLEPRPRAFIAADQVWVVMACICHAFALGTERPGRRKNA